MLKFHDLAEAVLQKFHPKLSKQYFFYNFRPGVHNDVISGVAEDYVGVDVHVKFGGSRSNGSRDIRCTDFMSNERT